VSKGYRLPAKWVIHTVGPIWRGGDKNEDNLLAGCYRNSLDAAAKLGAKTLAFPSISTGAYRFPLEKATEIALKETKIFLEKNQTPEQVMFVCFGERVLKTYQDTFARLFGGLKP